MELVIDRVTKQFKNKLAVDKISLRLQPGVYGLLGANGAGKTTLMRIIAGLEKADKGEIIKDTKSISFMFQEDRLIPFVSVLKNLTAVCSEETALHYLKLMGLESEKDAKIKGVAIVFKNYLITILFSEIIYLYFQ